jgi:hypothetical protein
MLGAVNQAVFVAEGESEDFSGLRSGQIGSE